MDEPRHPNIDRHLTPPCELHEQTVWRSVS